MDNNEIPRQYEYFCCASFSRAWLNYNAFFVRSAELKEHDVNHVCLPTPWSTSLKSFNVVTKYVNCKPTPRFKL
jgi:hypothetical protein